MLYTLFLYQQESGLLLYDKNFQDISEGKMELFSSFFAALKSFVSEMVLDGSKDLKNIELGDYSVVITALSELKTDLVIIADNEDIKIVNKIIPKIIKVLLKFAPIFLEWEGKKKDLDVLELPISEVIQSEKKLIEKKTLLDKPESFLKSLWVHKKELSEEEILSFSQEAEKLKNELEKSINLQRRLSISEKLLEISEKLKNTSDFIKYQELVKNIRKEFADAKVKLHYFLERIKVTLSQAVNALGTKPYKEGTYRDVYVNLYSFSNKLKLISESENYKEYQDMANMLIEKDDISDEVLRGVISKIMNMKEDIAFYIN